MKRGHDGIWRTVGGIVVSDAQQKELSGMSNEDYKTVYQRVYAGDFDNKVAFVRNATTEQRQAYRDGERAMTEKLKAALEEENGLSDHPKKDTLWRLAWDEGHSAGYAEVTLVYDRLAELLKP